MLKVLRLIDQKPLSNNKVESIEDINEVISYYKELNEKLDFLLEKIRIRKHSSN